MNQLRARAGAAIVVLTLGGAAGHSAAAGDAEAGRAKARMCAVCHGIDGIGKRPDTPNIAGQVALYMREQLRRYRSGARAHAEMSVIAGGLSDEDIENLVSWYSSITVTVELPP